MRFGRDPFVGLRSGRRQPGVNYHQLRFGFGAAPEQIVECHRVSFRLVCSQEKKIFRRAQILCSGRLISAVSVREIAEPEGPGQRISSGVVTDRANVGIVRTSEKCEKAIDQ